MTYIDHSLTFEAEPICGAQLEVPAEGEQDFVECAKCEAVIQRQLDWLAKVAP